MPTYTVLADVNHEEFQNVQDLAVIWADIRNDIEKLGGELIDTYAVLGGYDFQLTFEAADEDAAIKIAFAIERYGLDTQTHQVVDIDRLGELTEDL